MQLDYGSDSGSSLPEIHDFLPAWQMKGQEPAHSSFPQPVPWTPVEMPFGEIQNLLGNFSEQTGAQFD